MSTRCEICGKIFSNEPKFTIESGGEICEDCYLAFDSPNSNKNEETTLDREIQEVIQNKETYTLSKLENTLEWLKENGYHSEAEELQVYIENYGRENEDSGDTVIYSNGRKYEGSKTSLWTDYLKITCVILWGINTIAGLFIGVLIGKITDYAFLTTLIGTGLGFMSGFVMVAVAMTFITMCENISTMTDNTAKILAKLDE